MSSEQWPKRLEGCGKLVTNAAATSSIVAVVIGEVLLQRELGIAVARRARHPCRRCSTNGPAVMPVTVGDAGDLVQTHGRAASRVRCRPPRRDRARGQGRRRPGSGRPPAPRRCASASITLVVPHPAGELHQGRLRVRRWSPRGAAPRSLHLVAQVVHEGVKMNLAFRKRTLKPAPAAVPGGTSGGAEAGSSLVLGRFCDSRG